MTAKSARCTLCNTVFVATETFVLEHYMRAHKVHPKPDELRRILTNKAGRGSLKVHPIVHRIQRSVVSGNRALVMKSGAESSAAPRRKRKKLRRKGKKKKNKSIDAMSPWVRLPGSYGSKR